MLARLRPGEGYSQAGSARQRRWKIGGKKSQALNGSTLIGACRLATANQLFDISHQGAEIIATRATSERRSDSDLCSASDKCAPLHYEDRSGLLFPGRLPATSRICPERHCRRPCRIRIQPNLFPHP